MTRRSPNCAGSSTRRADRRFGMASRARFFGMNFQDADEFNAKHGNQFIADLMPKHPVYIAMLPENARAVIGVPHPSGRAAMRMLEEEGFAWEKYVDIFDGGPTMTVRTDQIRSMREAEDSKIVAIDDRLGDHKAGEKRLVAGRRSGRFPRCLWLGSARWRRHPHRPRMRTGTLRRRRRQRHTCCAVVSDGTGRDQF